LNPSENYFPLGDSNVAFTPVGGGCLTLEIGAKFLLSLNL